MKCLSQVLDLSVISTNQLVESLTMLGIEVENSKAMQICNIENLALEITTAPNRNDLSNIIGIAREVGIILKQKIDFKFRNKFFLHGYINYRNIFYHKTLDSVTCITVLMKDIKVGQAPIWMQQYLKVMNCTSTNILVDIKTYIKLKWGLNISIFPLLDIINKNSTISISEPTRTQFCDVNNNTLRILKIADKKIINSDDLINNKIKLVKTLVVHVDSLFYTNHCSITENIDKNIVYHVAQEVVILCKKYCNAIIIGYQNQGFDRSPKNLKVLKKDLVRVLGPTIQQHKSWDIQVTNILTLLDFSPKVYIDHWLIVIPEYRSYDLIREIDIIEEVARVYGYNFFRDNIPKVNIIKTISSRETLIRYLRSFLRALGLYELVHSPFAKKEKTIVYNPLSNEYESLREYVTQKLIYSLSYNIDQSSGILHGFEIGKVFSLQYNSKTITEALHLGLVFGYGKYLRPSWIDKPSSTSWFQAKGLVFLMCQSLGINLSWDNLELNSNEKQFLHHHRTAVLTFRSEKVGFFGEINPLLRYELNLKERFYICEINLDLVNSFLKNSTVSQYQLQPYSKYPSIARDISVIVPRNTNVSSIIEKFNDVKSKIIHSIKLLNQYQGYPIPQNKKSLNFRVKYQSLYKTLTKFQIIQLNKRIREMITNELGADITL